MRKPIFIGDITHLGVWHWIEVEGYEKMVRRQSGLFASAESEIMGWNCRTIGEILVKQREVNYAPRWRMWNGKNEPTAEERAAGEWRDNCRAWLPSMDAIMQDRERIYEWQETGRTQWPEMDSMGNTTGDLISREATLAALRQFYCPACDSRNGIMCRTCYMFDALNVVEDIPAVDAEPVRLGEWETDGIAAKCSLCAKTLVVEQADDDLKFCPFCGKRLEGKRK